MRGRVYVVCLHQGPIFLRPHAQVVDPLVEPDAFERSRGHLSERPGSVWPAQGAESFFRPRAAIGVTRVRRCAYPRQNEEGGKVRLIEHVHVGVRAKVSTIPEEPECWVKGKLATRVSAVFAQFVLRVQAAVLTPASSPRNK